LDPNNISVRIDMGGAELIAPSTPMTVSDHEVTPEESASDTVTEFPGVTSIADATAIGVPVPS
jgi:hypothetical protein